MGTNKSKKKARGRKDKINLVFDESKRREFLGGFRKRKAERQKKAQEEIKQKLKDEKKRIKQENKEAYKRLVVSHRPIPELEKLLEDEYEDEDVNVKIVELSAENLGVNNRWIGPNKPKSEENDKEEVSNESDDNIEDDELPGMGLKLKKTAGDNSGGENEPSGDNVKSKKEIKKILKKQATKQVQKSKIFQLKNKLERQKNKKKSQQKRDGNHKFKAKKGKKGGDGKVKGRGGLGRRKQ